MPPATRPRPTPTGLAAGEADVSAAADGDSAAGADASTDAAGVGALDGDGEAVPVLEHAAATAAVIATAVNRRTARFAGMVNPKCVQVIAST